MDGLRDKRVKKADKNNKLLQLFLRKKKENRKAREALRSEMTRDHETASNARAYTHIPSEAFENGILLALSIRSPVSIKSFAVHSPLGSMSMKFGTK